MNDRQKYTLTIAEMEAVDFARGRYGWADLVDRNTDDEGRLSLDYESCEMLADIFEEEGFPLLKPQTDLFGFMINCVLNFG